jgi:hypothetical protein
MNIIFGEFSVRRSVHPDYIYIWHLMPVIIAPKFDISIQLHRKQIYSVSYGLLSCKISGVVYPVVKLLFKLQAR